MYTYICESCVYQKCTTHKFTPSLCEYTYCSISTLLMKVWHVWASTSSNIRVYINIYELSAWQTA